MWDEDVNTKLHAASLCGYLQHGANEDAVDAENRSPLHWAGVCWGTGGNRAAGTVGRERGGEDNIWWEGQAGPTIGMVRGEVGSCSE